MRILIIRLSSLGDVALVSAVLDALGEHEAALLTYEPFGELYKHDPRVRAIQIPRGTKPAEAARAAGEGWDVVLDLHAKPLTFLISRLIDARRRVRVKKRALQRRLAVWFKLKIPFVPVFKLYCEAAERALGKAVPCKPKLYPPPSGPEVPENAVVLAPGGRSSARRWPYFPELAELLLSEGYTPVWVGLKGEGRGEPGLNLLGKTSIPELLWVISRAKALVSGDTAPLHLARGLGVKAVAVFGPTTPELGFGLLPEEGVNLGVNLPCRPCALHGNPRKCPYSHKCLREIKPEDVYRVLLPLLRG